MNLETKITIYKFTPQVFTLTPFGLTQNYIWHSVNNNLVFKLFFIFFFIFL